MTIELPDSHVETAQELAKLFGLTIEEIFFEHSGAVLQQYIDGNDSLANLLDSWWWPKKKAKQVAARIFTKFDYRKVEVERVNGAPDYYRIYIA